MDPVNHFELPAKDRNRANSFYATVFGWQIQTMDEMGMPYTIVRTTEVDDNNMCVEKGAINGGIMDADETGTAPMIVITVKSIEDTLTKIQENGGEKLVDKMPVGEMGHYARFKDSEGNVMGLWEEVTKQ
ncbi:VOC family protein [candidate division WWE3 bacterium]|uniref:VOC family protein n=1 Tax=candidate division WWE3 bacterium TaxID=2053526 RepID=A0A955EBM1_UNCKA|nr:VOC family protein [candidate division WWE3 bacterium]